MPLPSSSLKVLLLLVWSTIGILACSGCNRSPAGQIERVLKRSAEVSKKAGAFKAAPAMQAGYVADGLQAIDASGCPPEFRVAFQEHCNVWRNAQSAYANNTLATSVVEGVVAGLTENFSGFGAAQGGANAAHQYINQTYYNLTVIAAAHGARIPRSVVE